MRDYEMMVIISTQLSDEEKQQEVTKLENFLKVAEAEEIKTDVWGNRKLAYPIDKKENGYYVLYTFKANGENLTELETKLNIQETLMRYMIVKK